MLGFRAQVIFLKAEGRARIFIKEVREVGREANIDNRSRCFII
jgi:hypothetical protein